MQFGQSLFHSHVFCQWMFSCFSCRGNGIVKSVVNVSVMTLRESAENAERRLLGKVNHGQ